MKRVLGLEKNKINETIIKETVKNYPLNKYEMNN